MTNDTVSKLDWKEIGITALVTLTTAAVGCTIAVIVAQTLVIPAINKAKEKRAAAKDKDAKK